MCLNDNHLTSLEVQLVCYTVKSEYLNRDYQFFVTKSLPWKYRTLKM